MASDDKHLHYFLSVIRAKIKFQRIQSQVLPNIIWYQVRQIYVIMLIKYK